jgi:hypothetical protein
MGGGETQIIKEKEKKIKEEKRLSKGRKSSWQPVSLLSVPCLMPVCATIIMGCNNPKWWTAR